MLYISTIDLNKTINEQNPEKKNVKCNKLLSSKNCNMFVSTVPLLACENGVTLKLH